jgi:catechol 2,3-dioxygenase-like lactoylglutathione lyase family enzyme
LLAAKSVLMLSSCRMIVPALVQAAFAFPCTGVGDGAGSLLPHAASVAPPTTAARARRVVDGRGTTRTYRVAAADTATTISQTARVIDHVSIQCSDLAASARFYDAVLGVLGAKRMIDFGEVIGYGVDSPTFWLGPHHTGEGFRESHLAFTAADRAAVDAFFGTALQQDAEVLHSPREWPDYHQYYYGAFVRDPDGNNVEAVCHLPPASR